MFVKECNSHLKEEIGMLEQQLKQEEGILEQLEEYSQVLATINRVLTARERGIFLE